MKYDILTIGFPMVEMVRRERGVPFMEVGDFYGPYPSNDTCIMIDVAARLGKKCCYLGKVGDDGFGNVVTERLKGDGVDISYLQKASNNYTPVIFVRYELDGKREYLPVIENSACFTLNSGDINPNVIKQSKWVHLSGEIISMCKEGRMKIAIEKFLHSISSESKVSLDPNFVEDPLNMEDFLKPFIARADVILPSEGEAKLILQTQTDEEACETLSDQGKIVALKQGKKGCTIYSSGNKVSIPGFDINEIDPTGCGDSFCAGFLFGMIEGWSLETVGRFANATGALQATVLGPMEGAKYLNEVFDFMDSQL